MAQVLTVFKEINKGDYVYHVMGYNEKPLYLHINNIKTDNDSVLVPLSVLKDLLFIPPVTHS